MGATNNQEVIAALSGPAVFSNRFVITVGGGTVRLAFLENTLGPEHPFFRTAVVMSMTDAADLVSTLIQMLHGETNRAAAPAESAEPSIETENPNAPLTGKVSE